MKIVKTIRKNYVIPANSASFSGLIKQKQKYGSLFTLPEIRQGLQGIPSYTLHKERKQPSIRNPFFIYKKRQQIQMDLLDISILSEQNNDTKYLFCAIDMFSKLAFVRPLKSKSATAVAKVIRQMISFFNPGLEEVLSDRGTEFKNSLVSQIFLAKNIRHRFTNSEIKCAGVERFNKTLQGKIYKYLTHNKTARYIEDLHNLVSSYNNTVHSTISLTPMQAEEESAGEFVRGKLASFYSRGSAYQRRRKFKIGDHVRISISKANFQRSYGQTQKHEIFEIDSINKHLPIPMYFIRSLYDGELIEGGFYEAELTKVDCLRIRVLQRKGQQIEVLWMDDPDKKTSWLRVDKINAKCDT